MKMRVNSFFSGVGGFELAFQNSGFEILFSCEKDSFCRSVLKRHWADTPCAEDICSIDPLSLPDAEVWTAGFPCQDLSLARTPHGRSGLRGNQSGLFFEFLELLSIRRPPVVLLENVAGLLNSHKGADFSTLITSLAQLGYAVAWRVLNARYFGTPQSRPRVFICAWKGAPEKAYNVLFENGFSPIPRNERAGFITESKDGSSGISVPQISFCVSATSGRHTGLDWARSYVTYEDEVRRLTPLECERLQGFPDHWTIPGKDYVLPLRGYETQRYRAIGNAVCIPVVEWIAKRIALALTRTTEVVRPSSAEDIIPIFRETTNKKVELNLLEGQFEPTKWKTGGLLFLNTAIHAPVSPAPVTPVITQLIDLIDKDRLPQRYFLSSNAITGILRRVDRMGRKLFPPLDATLRRIANADIPRKANAATDTNFNDIVNI